MEIQAAEPLAVAVVSAIQGGQLDVLRELLDSRPKLISARIVDAKGGHRTLLHIATDWPGHFPNVSAIITLLIERGADPSTPFIGPVAHETPLHWAASSNDTNAIDALLDGGANIEAPGAVFTNGTAMSDAVIFAQWNAARLLLARGAKTTFTESAALGLVDRLEQHSDPEPQQLTAALWHASRAGQLAAVQWLVARGADIQWVGWDGIAPLDGAVQSGNQELIAWLISQGAKHARGF